MPCSRGRQENQPLVNGVNILLPFPLTKGGNIVLIVFETCVTKDNAPCLHFAMLA